MPASSHLEFAPPPTRGGRRAMVLALLAHLGLVAVLAVGVAWKRETPPVAVEAELWAAVPQEAAPPAPTDPEPEPAPAPQAPEPPLPVQPAPPPAPPVADAPKATDIALAREKEKLQREKLALDKQRKEREARERQEQQAKADKAARAEKAEKLAKARAQEQAQQKTAKAAELAAQKNREEQLKRMTALAGGGSGSTSSTGTAARSAGPSASYNARVAARIKPNVTYTEMIVGNPKTEIEVTLSAGGDVLSRRISKRSGNASWDNAALNAIDKTAKLPLDDGKVWSPMIIELSPQTLLGQ